MTKKLMHKVIRVKDDMGKSISFRGRWLLDGCNHEMRINYRIAETPYGRFVYHEQRSTAFSTRVSWLSKCELMRDSSIPLEAREAFVDALGVLLPWRRKRA